MKKAIFAVFLLLYYANFSWAQYPNISHLDWMQGQVNPAFIGINKQENILIDYNRSWRSNEVNSNLGILRYDRAILTSNNKNIGGFGASILNNKINYKENIP